MENCDTEAMKESDLPQCVEFKISHQKQKYNWDCGVSCVLMVLPAERREELLNNFSEVCKEEGFNKSTWTIDLCYLLWRYSVQHQFCTVTLGVNPGYENQSFYAKVLRKDERRVVQRFSEAKAKGLQVQKASVTHHDLIRHLATHGPIILLTNSSLLLCDYCGTFKFLAELRQLLPKSVYYNGHYIVLCGYSLSKKKFLYRNPTYNDRVCCTSFSAMDQARLSYGTDEDAIFIFSNRFERKSV